MPEPLRGLISRKTRVRDNSEPARDVRGSSAYQCCPAGAERSRNFSAIAITTPFRKLRPPHGGQALTRAARPPPPHRLATVTGFPPALPDTQLPRPGSDPLAEPVAATARRRCPSGYRGTRGCWPCWIYQQSIATADPGLHPRCGELHRPSCAARRRLRAWSGIGRLPSR